VTGGVAAGVGALDGQAGRGDLDVLPVAARADLDGVAGVGEYLTKPLDVAQFRAVVDNLLSRVPSQS
jgi:hypothetical protein